MKTFDPSQIVRNLQTVEEEVFEPTHAFSDFAVSEKLKGNVAERGYVTPTPVQDRVIPEILAGKDVVGLANTGTGKTAAFLIPLIEKATKSRGQRVLIITPTRELAAQIEDELRLLSRGLGINSVVCIGGVSIGAQINRLRARPQFVVGTPGRLLDLVRQRKVNFSEFGSVVLDEVDRMLEMGFIGDVQKIISQLPNSRQSLFFSATLTDSVRKTMQQFTKNPVTISVKTQDMLSNVDQEILKVNGSTKLDMLQNLLDDREFKRVLIFGRTKRGAEGLSRILAKKGFQVASIHGNKTQNQRKRALDLFRRGTVSILIATDVVARGIDVEDISHVINYELPETYENYLHRIGRTGRAGKKGRALTFVG